MSNADKLRNAGIGIYADVKHYVIENEHVDEDKVDDYINDVLSANDIIEAFLRWNGIIGYENPIIRLAKAFYGNEGEE